MEVDERKVLRSMENTDGETPTLTDTVHVS